MNWWEVIEDVHRWILVIVALVEMLARLQTRAISMRARLHRNLIVSVNQCEETFLAGDMKRLEISSTRQSTRGLDIVIAIIMYTKTSIHTQYDSIVFDLGIETEHWFRIRPSQPISSPQVPSNP